MKDLNQEFDFKTGFCINGIFTLESNDHLNPCSFDISLCDRWGEKLSVIFADGLLNDFTIKKLGEKHGKGEVTKKSGKFKIALSRGNDIEMNFVSYTVKKGYEMDYDFLTRRQKGTIEFYNDIVNTINYPS